MKIAVVGGGVSGLVAARRLCGEHEVHLFEAGDYLGGHTNTVDIELPHGEYSVDTGFMVFNERTYPNFLQLLRDHDIAWQDSDMSFSVRCDRTGLEYNGGSLNGLFAQRLNLVRPSFLSMLRDILRFNGDSIRWLESAASDTTSLGDFLDENHYGRMFVDQYLLPMTAAIWSAAPDDVLAFPARFLFAFFQNHGLLQILDRPIWKTIPGGARRYVEAVRSHLGENVHLRTPIARVTRRDGEVLVTDTDDQSQTFDKVVLGTHADQSLRLLADADGLERDIIGSFRYQRNDAVLHTSTALLPRSRRAWASWNYHIPRDPQGQVTVTYDVNRLQKLGSPVPICVTLNEQDLIDPETVLRRFVYDHPLYNQAAISAQRRYDEVNGHRDTYYCGAYWGAGFHEDGVKSGLAAAAQVKQDAAQSALV